MKLTADLLTASDISGAGTNYAAPLPVLRLLDADQPATAPAPAPVRPPGLFIVPPAPDTGAMPYAPPSIGQPLGAGGCSTCASSAPQSPAVLRLTPAADAPAAYSGTESALAAAPWLLVLVVLAFLVTD